MTTPLVYAVVLNFRNHDDTVECVRALERADYPNLRIVVVDNASDNGSEGVLREALPQHVFLQTGSNRGYAAGNNFGLRLALRERADYALILNNDVVVEPGFLTPLVVFAQAHPEAGVIGSLVLRPTGQPDRNSARRVPPLAEIFWNQGLGRWLGQRRAWRDHHYYENEYDFDAPREVDIVSGSCLLLRTSMLDRIGLLDERTFLFWEEFMLAARSRAAGYRTWIVPASRVLHKECRSTRTLGIRVAGAYLRSLDHYLRHYRGVPWPLRKLVMLGPALYQAAGVFRTLTGMRRHERRLRPRESA